MYLKQEVPNACQTLCDKTMPVFEQLEKNG